MSDSNDEVLLGDAPVGKPSSKEKDNPSQARQSSKDDSAVKAENSADYDAPTDDEGDRKGTKTNEVHDADASKSLAALKAETDDEDEGELVVCRFVIKGLEGAGRDLENDLSGYATSDYYIDLVKQHHGLYDLVCKVYDILRKERLSRDSVYSHLWNLRFAGKVFRNGWRLKNFQTGEYDRAANSADIDDREPRILSSLAKPIANGQKGQFWGDVKFTAFFEVEVVNVAFETLDASADLSAYPKVSKVASAVVSGSVEDDWIEQSEKDSCATRRSQWQHYLSKESSWKRDRAGGYVPAKPVQPAWGDDETRIIGLLINAGAKFKKSWTGIMQYAFLDRAETAASRMWYQLRGKESYRIDRIGGNMTNQARIQLAKRLARRRMQHFLEKDVPKRDQHPYARVEKALRKRGKIDDATSESERKRLCAQWNSFTSELEKEGNEHWDDIIR